MVGYENDSVWKNMQVFLPVKNRISEETMPEEYYLPLNDINIHIDHYRVSKPKATIIMFHGVGGNGRLLSFIAVRLMQNGYEVICPDLPLYGYTVYGNTENSDKITYDTWINCGCEMVEYYQKHNSDNIFLFGLSAGGMLAYQVANECRNINGIIATCILDQRDSEVVKKTAANPFIAAVSKLILRTTHRIFGDFKIPMKMVANMKNIANNQDLANFLMRDLKSSGASVSLSFIHSLINPIIKVEPEAFNSCPFLLVHPGDDKWTDISLSRIFYDRLGCDKELRILEDGGHFPVEEKALIQLEEYCVNFLEKNI